MEQASLGVPAPASVLSVLQVGESAAGPGLRGSKRSDTKKARVPFRPRHLPTRQHLPCFNCAFCKAEKIAASSMHHSNNFPIRLWLLDLETDSPYVWFVSPRMPSTGAR